MSVDSIPDLKTFKDEINSGHALVFCFGTGTSEPYKSILSLIKTLSGRYNGIKSYGVDVDEGEAGKIAAELGITQLPIVMVYKDKKKIGEAVRPDASGLKALIQKLSTQE